MGSEMWVTEIHDKVSGRLIGRIGHGNNYYNASWAHSSYTLRFAGHRIHLIWEE